MRPLVDENEVNISVNVDSKQSDVSELIRQTQQCMKSGECADQLLDYERIAEMMYYIRQARDEAFYPDAADDLSVMDKDERAEHKNIKMGYDVYELEYDAIGSLQQFVQEYGADDIIQGLGDEGYIDELRDLQVLRAQSNLASQTPELVEIHNIVMESYDFMHSIRSKPAIEKFDAYAQKLREIIPFELEEHGRLSDEVLIDKVRNVLHSKYGYDSESLASYEDEIPLRYNSGRIHDEHMRDVVMDSDTLPYVHRMIKNGDIQTLQDIYDINTNVKMLHIEYEDRIAHGVQDLKDKMAVESSSLSLSNDELAARLDWIVHECSNNSYLTQDDKDCSSIEEIREAHISKYKDALEADKVGTLQQFVEKYNNDETLEYLVRYSYHHHAAEYLVDVSQTYNGLVKQQNLSKNTNVQQCLAKTEFMEDASSPQYESDEHIV